MFVICYFIVYNSPDTRVRVWPSCSGIVLIYLFSNYARPFTMCQMRVEITNLLHAIAIAMLFDLTIVGGAGLS